MNKQERIKELKKEIEDLESRLNDWGKIFYEEWDITSIKYLGDAFSEFADGRVDIYYSDLEDYYEEHPKECLEALKEFGYSLDNFSDLNDLIYKGAAVAQYQEVFTEVAENEYIFEELIEKFEELEELEKEVEE
jgi:hypothetical protein